MGEQIPQWIERRGTGDLDLSLLAHRWTLKNAESLRPELSVSKSRSKRKRKKEKRKRDKLKRLKSKRKVNVMDNVIVWNLNKNQSASLQPPTEHNEDGEGDDDRKEEDGNL